MNPKISIIIPIYKVEKYLIECLESVRNQTFTDFEVIMVNDGSSDASPVIADNYCKRDERFKLFHQENQGLSAARNFGTSQSKGEYIFFLDSDDKIVENTLEILHRIAQDKQADIVIGACKYFNDAGDYWLMTPGLPTIASYDSHDAIRKDEDGTIPLSFTTAWCKLVKADIVRQNLFPIGVWYEDSATTYRWYMAASEIYSIDLNLYAYRQHDSSIMSTSGRNLVKHFNDNIKNISQKVFNLQNFGYDPHVTLNSYIDKLYRGQSYYEDFDDEAKIAWDTDYDRYFSRKDFPHQALILTHSAEIEQVEALARALPDLCIHIVAYTVVAPSLIDLAENLENIFIHPFAHSDLIETLLNQSDIYLDINYYAEVDDIVNHAIQKGLPVVAFEATAHRPDLLDQDMVFPTDELDAMVDRVKFLLKEDSFQSE
ncbi:glycosyltransferase [Aerococcus urinae]|uniref:glycosyltransferase n=1 Tax=Aerococcus urinae TaxID=1376 RepID=UPI0025510D2A|nr:glycosyltransferase [Aerococcus urinae]MDK7716079.1 glycosyltransferase [Aerococcus urinae]